MKNIFLFSLACIFAMTGNISATQNISFDHLSLDDGLTHISATAIQQDSLGRIWIGTRDGINIYDGTTIKNFRSIRGDSNSLLGTNIRDFFLDGSDAWICTREGISHMDIQTNKFDGYPVKDVECLINFKGELLLGSEKGLYTLNTTTKTIEKRSAILDKNLSINDLYIDHAQILWISTKEGLYRYDARAETSTQIMDGDITKVYIDKQKRIWVGTDGNGFFLLNKNFKIVTHYKNTDKEKPIASNFVRDFEEDVNGDIWVGTFLGINILERNSLNISQHTHDPENPNSLSHNSVYCLINDFQGTMWVGTYFGGVNYFNPKYNIYTRYHSGNDLSTGTGYRVIGKMLEDNQHNLWIATEGGGLDYFNRKTGIFKHYRYKKGDKVQPYDNVKSIYLHNETTLLFGAHLGGLYILNIPDGTIENISALPEKNDRVASDIVHSIIPYRGNYLLATHIGVLRFDYDSRKVSHLFNEKQRAQIGEVVYCIFEDSFGKLWIGTEKNGLFVYDSSTKKLQHFSHDPSDLKSISNNSIFAIYEDHLFRLWVGTLGGGLNLYDRDQNIFKAITQTDDDGQNNFIYGITESRFGNLWVLTSRGLSIYDADNDRFYNYNKNNGFPMSLNNEGALCLTSDGEIFIGGIDGLLSFNEKDIFSSNKDIKLILSTLSLNNKTVKVGDETEVLSKDLPFTEAFSLKPNQNAFSIQFSACNYIRSNQSILQYKLDGFNDEWITANSSKTATYTNLNPGQYTFKVRALDTKGGEVLEEKSVLVNIEPPLYMRWYAFAFYLFFILGVFFVINKTYITQIRLKDTLINEKRDKEQMKLLNQSKLKFFTNISHEFRTPLTLITGTLESLLEDPKTKPNVYRKLNAIHSSARRLNNLISELLDFRKLDQGFLKLKVYEHELHPFLNEIYSSFVEFSHSHKITYTYQSPANKINLWFDKVQLEKVFYNLLSNAFKIVEEDCGKVEISIRGDDEFVNIDISDNGPGMAQEKIDKIFDRFYQIDRMQGKIAGKGSGLGLALSKGIVKEHHGQIIVKSIVNEGTTFTVQLRKGNKHFEASELQTPSEAINEVRQHIILDDIEIETETVELNQAPSVLVVEDNDEVRSMIVNILKDSFHLFEAKNGIEGMQIALKEQPDMILSDVMMPKMSGTEMCAKLKRNIQTCHIPIVLLTARTAMEYKIEGLENGADDYITKPFSVKLLRTRIKNLIQNRQILQQKFKTDPLSNHKEIVNNNLDLKLLNDAKDIIEQHLDDTSFDVNTFAKQMGLGRTRLYSKIKGITGQTPNEFILSTRLKKASEMLLSNPELNVSEIAYSVGFSTPRYFSRCFREHFGTSPSKYGHTGGTNEDEKESQ